MMQAFWRGGLAVTVAVGVACSGGQRAPSSGLTPPADPELAIHQFMSAVNENNLLALGDLWGTERGPASRTFNDQEELEKRLTVMQRYLVHDSYRVVGATDRQRVASSSRERGFDVELLRRGCRPVVPFVLIETGNGWLVKSVDLAQAGTPARRCAD